jgi:hypothetical protein
MVQLEPQLLSITKCLAWHNLRHGTVTGRPGWKPAMA